MRPVSAGMYRAIFEASPDGVLVVSPRGIIQEANAAAHALFGYEAGTLAGIEIEALVPEAARERHVGHRRRYVAHPAPRPMGGGIELVGLRKDGETFPAEISLSPLHMEDGPPHVIATVRDVTQRNRLRDFSAGALLASEEERQRIARELHDDTAQRLSSLLVRLRLLESASTGGEQWRERFESLREELAQAAESVRRVARGLRPPELEDAGVGPALRAHARGLLESVGLEVFIDVEPVDHLLGADAKLVLYRVVQEALSNVLRHSGAGRARVEVRSADSRVVASVEDSGCGFHAEARGAPRRGLGLLGMQERAAMVGGHVSIDSRPGEGTRVRLEVPVAVPDHASDDGPEREVLRV